MSATTPIMEVAGIGSIKLVEAVHNVLAGMTVNHVQQNGDAVRVGHIHQLLQFFWCSIATASAHTKKIGEMKEEEDPPYETTGHMRIYFCSGIGR